MTKSICRILQAVFTFVALDTCIASSRVNGGEPTHTVTYSVSSAGAHADSNPWEYGWTIFYRNNSYYYYKTGGGGGGRGFNVSVIDPETGGLWDYPQNFDVWGSYNSAWPALTNYLNDVIPNGMIVMVGVCDDAAAGGFAPGVADTGMKALEALGALKIRSYTFRSSYCLISIKGQGPAIGEELTDGTTVYKEYTIITPDGIHKPTRPQPADGATAVALNPALKFLDVSGATSVQVLLDTVNPPVRTAYELLGNWNEISSTKYLQRDTLYYWRVNLFDSQGIKTEGNVWTFRTTVVGQVDNISPANQSAELPLSTSLTWTTASGATSYLVYVRKYYGALVLLGETTNASFNIGPLDPATTHSWRVDAKNGAEVTPGLEWSFTTIGLSNTKNPFPSNKAIDVPTNVILKWDPVDNAAYYYTSLGVSPNTYSVYSASVTNPELSPPQLQPGTRHLWQVTTYGNNGVVYGDVWSFTTQAPFTWAGGDGAWAIGSAGWDAGTWVDGNNVVIGRSIDTPGVIVVPSNATIRPGTILFNPPLWGGYTLVVNGNVASVGALQLESGVTVRGTGAINRTLQTDATSAIWPGTALVASNVPVAGETLFVAGLDMSNDGRLKFALNKNGASQKLLVTGYTCQLSGILSLGTQAGVASGATYTVLTSSTGSITGTFSTIQLNGTVVTGNSQVSVVYSPNAVKVTLIGNVTPVTIDAFSAKPLGAGVALSWNAVSEFQNAGFNVYRRIVESAGSEWTRINPQLISGRITSPDFKSFRLYDWTAAGVYEYKLESVSIQGVSEEYAGFAGPVTVDAIEQATSSEALTVASESVELGLALQRAEKLSASVAALAGSQEQFTRMQSEHSAPMLAYGAHGQLLHAAHVREITSNTAEALMGSSVSAANKTGARAASANIQSIGAGARWFTSTASRAGSYSGAKVVYHAPGVMLIPQSMLPAGYNAEHLSITREGRALTALATTGNGLVVFAQGYQDDYTNKDVLFLRRISGTTTAGKATHALGLFASTMPVNAQSPASVTSEYHDVYFDFSIRPYSITPWFSSQYLINGTTQSFSIATANTSSGAALLTVNLWSLTHTDMASPDHALQVLVNDQPAGQAVWSGGDKMLQLSFQIPPSVLRKSANKIDLVTPDLTGVASQIAFVHSMKLSYTQLLDGSAPLEVLNTSASTMLYEVSNLPESNAWLVDARYPDHAALAPYETQAQGDGTYKLRFNGYAGGTGRYVVVPAGRENLPISVSRRQVKPVKPAAYLAAGPSQFGAGVQPLLMAHAKEGLLSTFVDQEQIFDYYNYGRYGPAGIQNAVRSTRPQYLLLLGRTTYDYRNYSGLNVDPLCPTFLVSTSFWTQATSDSMFGDLGRGYPEVAVGRLPVNNPDELRVSVQRIVSYKGLTSGWRGHAVADSLDPEVGDFSAQADALMQSHPDVAWQKNYLGVTYQTSQEVNAALKDAASGGADLIMYVGHGNATRLGKDAPRILDTSTVQQWTGNMVFLQSTCTANWMAKNENDYKSIAIQALTQPQGGISASIASSTYTTANSAAEFMNELIYNATAGLPRWGAALLKTQRWAYSKGGTAQYADLYKTEQLFGDPAMHVFANPHAPNLPRREDK